MQNFLGLFIRGFLPHLQACINIIYLNYIICENAFFYSELCNILTIQNLNQSQQQPNFFVTSFMQKVLILCDEIYTSKVLQLFAAIKKIIQENCNS